MSRAPRSRRASRRPSLLRALSLAALLPLAVRSPAYVRLTWELVRDPRVPTERKALLGLAAGYVLSPWDLLPRFPLIGALDDLIVICLALSIFAEDLPEDVLEEKLAGLGISRAEYERDLAQVRWIIPWPLYRLVLGLPGAVRAGGTIVRQTGLDRRLRERIYPEGSTA